MPVLYPSASQATSGLIASATIEKKPLGEKIVIRRITLAARVGTLYFARTYGRLYNSSKGAQIIGMGEKIVVGTSWAESWRGETEWPEGFTLRLSARVQIANETISWTVEYDIIEPTPAERKRWGQ